MRPMSRTARSPSCFPISVDHASYLGDTPADIAIEKAGIIKAGATAIVAEQRPEVLDVLLARAAEVGATLLREGEDFGVEHRVAAVGGQVVTLRGLRATYEDVFLPLYGEHQAQNAAVALAAVEAFAGPDALAADLVAEAFAAVTSPGRLEVVRRSPTIVLDAAHNPHGAAAAAAALDDSFAFSPLIGVIGVMADKDYEGVIAAFEPHFAHLICTAELLIAGDAGREVGRGGAGDLRRGPGERRSSVGGCDRPGRRAGRSG